MRRRMVSNRRRARSARDGLNGAPPDFMKQVADSRHQRRIYGKLMKKGLARSDQVQCSVKPLHLLHPGTNASHTPTGS